MTDTSTPRRVLTLRELSVRTSAYPLLEGVSFTVDGDERVGLIGESGSGKSLTALSIMGLLSPGLTASGSVTVLDGEVVGTKESALARRRGRDLAMVFQEPMTALNPTMRVGRQIAETMLLHDTQPTKKAAYDEAVRLLERVGLPDPKRAARSYPHQLSGGQRQRAVIAIAMANEPDLLICDEPTTALDVTVQAQVLDLVVSEADRQNAALLFITHDLAVVAMLCQRVLVMYGGRIVEAGTVQDTFTNPRHPYTAGLIAASDLDAVDADGHLTTIRGSVPPAGQFPEGCVFANRCDFATDICKTQPPWTDVPADVEGDGQNFGYACFHPLGTVAE